MVAYLMAGYPNGTVAVEAASAALRAGADVLEVGVPFSDPVADGPVIAEAGRAALAAGGGLESALRLVAALRAGGHGQPIVAMSYLNPLLAGGRRPLDDLAEAGADGLIVPDLPAGELPEFERAAARAGLALTFLVAPNTARRRLEAAIRSSSGFVYVIPLFGVTGARPGVAPGAAQLVERIRDAAAGRAPVACGFGVSRPEHVRELAAVADGVIVGSALVAALGEGPPAGGPQRVATLVTALSQACRRPAAAAIG